jgi:hypothetical protein
MAVIHACLLVLQAMQKKLAALIAAGGPHLADLEVEYDAVTQPHSLPDQRQQQQQLSLGGGSRVGLALTPAAVALIAGASRKQPASSTVAGTAGSIYAGCDAAGCSADSAESSREAMLAEALADAEGAVALLQSQLLAATTKQQLADQRLQDLQQRGAAAAVRHAQALAAAKQAGAAQLAALREAVARLGNRGELAGQVRGCALCLLLAVMQLRMLLLMKQYELYTSIRKLSASTYYKLATYDDMVNYCKEHCDSTCVCFAPCRPPHCL